jgi:hypothetical protein
MTDTPPNAAGPAAGDPERARLVEVVRQDVLAGFASLLSEPAFALDGPIAALGALVDGDLAVVGWVLGGVDDQEGFATMWPTGKHVEVRGVTIIDRRGGADTERWRFARHVDWNGLNAQLGATSGRASSPIPITSIAQARAAAARPPGTG